MMATLALAAALSSGAFAQTPSDRDVAQRFAGAWRLVSWTERLADGTTRQAATDVGYLMFADGGRMCATLANSKRAPWSGVPRSLESTRRKGSSRTPKISTSIPERSASCASDGLPLTVRIG